jgi:signal transduction histidine kinase
MADSDISYVAFLDNEGKYMIGTGPLSEMPIGSNLVTMQRPVMDIKGPKIGEVVLQYKTDRIRESFLRTAAASVLVVTITQIILFVAVFLISRKVISVEEEKSGLQKELDIQFAVAGEAQKVKIMVDNMRQAVFTVDNTGTVIEPISLYSEKVLEQKIANSKILDVLYSETNHEVRSGIETALSTVFGEDQLQWDLMEESFPRKLKRKILRNSSTDQESSEFIRSLKIQPNPIWSASEKLDKILFVIEDVTELEALEEEVLRRQRETAMIEDVMSSDRAKLRDFFEDSQNQLMQIIDHHKTERLKGPEVVMRDLHTLKGNARFYNLKMLSEAIHKCESALASSKEENESPNQSIFLHELKSALTISGQYREILNRIYNTSSSSGAEPINILAKQDLERLVTQLREKVDPETIKKIEFSISLLSAQSLKQLVLRYQNMIDQVAQGLGKKVQLNVVGDAPISEQEVQILQDCLGHLIRNSIDHGIESERERLEVGKSQIGVITVHCDELQGQLEICLEDDGRGLDGEKILSKALSKNIISESLAKDFTSQQKIELIFRPDFSTKEEITEISGRGVGMDAVKSLVTSAGGSIQVRSELGKGTRFRISIPRPFVEPPVSAESIT